MKLVVDTSSILNRFMHLEDREFGSDITVDGVNHHIPSYESCMERCDISFEKVLEQFSLRWTDIIMVLDQQGSGAARKKLCDTYKAKRSSRPKEFYEVYNKFVADFVELAMTKGAVSAVSTVTPATESDDLCHAICTRFPDTVLWFYDKDLFVCPATHHLYWDSLDELKFPVPRELIVLYRVLVTGDTSDNISSCKGFGPAAWDELKGLIGWEGLYELDKMFQEKRLHELADDVPHMKKLQLLIDQAEDLYMSY